MIFVLHYLLFNAGLPTVIILITLFLQTYSSASLSEIGSLLMALPFVSILIKPLFCALADRHRAHRLYLIGALVLMSLGYGSLAIPPFFPDFLEHHDRLVWYLDVAGIIVGYSAFGIIWSLGDALAVNGAQMAGVKWGSYRVWGVVSWGIMGIIIGQINELPALPKYVPAFFVLVSSLLIEALLLSFWPNKYFVMFGSLASQAGAFEGQQQGQFAGSVRERNLELATAGQLGEQKMSLGSGLVSFKQANGAASELTDPAPALADDLEASWPANRSLTGTLTAAGGGTLNATPKLIGAVANILMEDLGGTLRSSLKLGAGKHKRAGLDEILAEHQIKMAATAAASSGEQSLVNGEGNFCRGTIRRMMGLTAATTSEESVDIGAGPDTPTLVSDKAGTLRAVAESEKAENVSALVGPPQTQIPMKTCQQNEPAEAESLGSASALSTTKSQTPLANDNKPLSGNAAKSAEDLQLVLLKLIVRRDKTITKYLVLFTLFGFLLTCHLSYFYLHLERLCREKGEDFSSVTGGMLATHSISEILSFLFVPYYIPRVGRIGGLLTCALAYFVRFAYYGTYFVHTSPYTGVPFEFCHGIAYGIVYSLITDIAIECVDQVDEFMPELIERGLIAKSTHPNELKSPLRATMQGVFSGAFDGLGNGMGALFGGVFLDSYPFTSLWRVCALVCLAIMIVYPLTEWRAICGGQLGAAEVNKGASKRSKFYEDQQREQKQQSI